MSWLDDIKKKFSSENKTANKSTQNKAVASSQSKGKQSNLNQCTAPSNEKTGNLDNPKIRQLIPLRKLPADVFAYLPHKFLTYDENSTLFIQGQTSQNIYYLLKGSVALSTKNNRQHTINSEDIRSNFPLSSGGKHGATAVTLSKSLILTVSADVNKLIDNKDEDDSEDIDIEDIQLPNPLKNHKFFKDFIESYQHNQLKLPSLPDIAMKLRQAMKEEIGINEAVDIIQTDHAMTTKLIQIANSPLYSPASPINSCTGAINRLGLNATRNLVMTLGLKQLFQNTDEIISVAMKKVWKRSLYVSCLSFILAEETHTVDPDDALLAGLMSDIGVIPLLNFAAEYQGIKPSLSELKAAIPYFRAPVGELLLHNLDFPRELSRVPSYSEDWHYKSSGDEITLIDVIILAKLHSYFGLKDADNLPLINTIPAYDKLDKGQLCSNLSLEILRKANDRIKLIMSELS